MILLCSYKVPPIYNYFIIFFHKLARIKAPIYTITILAPVGKFNNEETIKPNKKHSIDIITDRTDIPLNECVNFLAITAGNTIRLDINNVPIILIPITTTTAVNNAIKN